jgi:hypothetical protein
MEELMIVKEFVNWKVTMSFIDNFPESSFYLSNQREIS